MRLLNCLKYNIRDRGMINNKKKKLKTIQIVKIHELNAQKKP